MLVMSRRAALLVACASLVVAGAGAAQQPPARGRASRPNVVMILTDDQGYGDVGVYGHPTIRTRNLDRMAAEGLKFTQFYAQPVCTPSRASLMTGRLPVRLGLAGGVLQPWSSGGLPASEITIAEGLEAQGYATGMIGKWHLGHLPQFLPTRKGFQSYFGIPYSNDMDRETNESIFTVYQKFDTPYQVYRVPLMRDEQVVERPADQHTLVRRYTEEAQKYIRAHRAAPFFLYLAYNAPHLPVYASAAFEGKSARGRYGDVVQEIDWNVGQLLRTLEQLNLDRNTLVLFASDNGPWAGFGLGTGSAGLLRGAKGSIWEGGVRVPAIAWWPGTIAPGRVTDALATLMDVFPTAMELAGGTMPSDREIDGVSLVPLLRGRREQVHDMIYYYQTAQLGAVRKGAWKLYVAPPAGAQTGGAQPAAGPPAAAQLPGAQAPAAQLGVHLGPTWQTASAPRPGTLYNLDEDPSEQFDVAAEHPDVVADLEREAERHRAGVRPVPSQLAMPRVTPPIDQRPK